MKLIFLALFSVSFVACERGERAQSEMPKESSKAEGVSKPVVKQAPVKNSVSPRPPTAQPMKFDPNPNQDVPRNAKLSKRTSGKFDLNVFTFSDGASGFDQVVEVTRNEKRTMLFSHVTEFATADDQMLVANYAKNSDGSWALRHQIVNLTAGKKTNLDCSTDCGFLAFTMGKNRQPLSLTPAQDMNGKVSLFDQKGKTVASFPTTLNFPIGANGGAPINRYVITADAKELIEYLPNSCRISVYETTEWNMIRKEEFEFDTENMVCPEGEKAFAKMTR